MEIKKEDGKVITTMTFSECFFGFDDLELDKEILDRFNQIINNPFISIEKDPMTNESFVDYINGLKEGDYGR